MSEQASPQAPRGRSTLGTILYWIRDLAISVVIAAVVIVFIYQPVQVEGTSMMPVVSDQERIFVNKFIYRFGIGEIQRGDLVVFWYPGDRSQSYIKRVIGLPGEVVAIQNGTVLVNGTPLDEPYVPPDYRDAVSMPARYIEAGHFFVLGDHRNSSNDSRMRGQVPRDCIFGKAVFVYWPLDKFGPVH